MTVSCGPLSGLFVEQVPPVRERVVGGGRPGPALRDDLPKTADDTSREPDSRTEVVCGVRGNRPCMKSTNALGRHAQRGD
jgi:hypothetical protein